ncbi:MAG: diacylglycerol kinase family lipid kinase [Candidatus Promineifilaceae bacterium]|nr:diacylglycerol kinase family lipid kinase [Candidatus Promineifilaceae bacterium]
MRVMVVLNPSADLGHGLQKREAIMRAGEKWGGLSLTVTKNRNHAREIATHAAEDGYDVVVAAGGDGTIHEVVNGLVLDRQNKTKLGIIPIGSGNDYAYALNIPDDISAAVELIFTGRPQSVDLGLVEDDRGIRELFNNNFGAGFDANVVIRVEEITRLHGFAKYFWGVLKTLVLDFRSLPFEMQFDDEKVSEDVWFMTFGIGMRHGGGFMLTPEAKIDDDLVDTCMVQPIGRLRALMLLNSAVKGTHIDLDVVKMRQSRRIKINCADPIPIHIDGEIFAFPADGVHCLKITSLPSAIEVVVR